MQFNTLILALASSVAIVSAAALPKANQNADTTAVIASSEYSISSLDERSAEADARFCGRPGEPCWVKVKRDAFPEAEARFCGRKGEPCWVKVKRDATPDAEAEARFCGRPGEPCWVKVKREALPEAEARFCGRKGEPCWVKVKRDLE